MKINIRPATLDDYSAVCEVYEEIDTQHRDQLPHIFRKPDGPPRELEYFSELISDENVGFFVAEADGQIAGFGHVLVKDSHEFPILVSRRYALVDAIAVKAAFRYQGIGKNLMAVMQEWSAGKGVGAIELNVYEFNQNAIAFYEGLGYQTYSRKMGKNI